jgi:hypothetical protein
MIFKRTGITLEGISDKIEFSKQIADPKRIKNIINILKMI